MGSMPVPSPRSLAHQSALLPRPSLAFFSVLAIDTLYNDVPVPHSFANDLSIWPLSNTSAVYTLCLLCLAAKPKRKALFFLRSATGVVGLRAESKLKRQAVPIVRSAAGIALSLLHEASISSNRAGSCSSAGSNRSSSSGSSSGGSSAHPLLQLCAAAFPRRPAEPRRRRCHRRTFT